MFDSGEPLVPLQSAVARATSEQVSPLSGAQSSDGILEPGALSHTASEGALGSPLSYSGDGAMPSSREDEQRAADGNLGNPVYVNTVGPGSSQNTTNSISNNNRKRMRISIANNDILNNIPRRNDGKHSPMNNSSNYDDHQPRQNCVEKCPIRRNNFDTDSNSHGEPNDISRDNHRKNDNDKIVLQHNEVHLKIPNSNSHDLVQHGESVTARRNNGTTNSSAKVSSMSPRYVQCNKFTDNEGNVTNNTWICLLPTIDQQRLRLIDQQEQQPLLPQQQQEQQELPAQHPQQQQHHKQQ